MNDLRTMLTFEDVLLEPGYSDIASRSEIDLATEFLGLNFRLPIISANMSNVTEYDMASVMTEQGAFYVVHRFMDDEQLYDLFDAFLMHFGPTKGRISFSVGVRDPEHEMEKVKTIAGFAGGILGELTVTVDTAQGHHQRVADMIKRLKDFGVQRVIAGNIATPEGYDFLEEAGADAIKVGIGPGAACTTREVTGVGVPQLSAIIDIDKQCRVPIYEGITGRLRTKLGPPVIADGGMKNSGDIVKALAAGADMVMLGSLFAGTDDAPGETRLDIRGKMWKRFNGNSIFGSNALDYTPEGVEGWVEAKGPVGAVLARLEAGIRSGCSYVGARNLQELRKKAKFIQITQAGYQIESAVRVTVD